MGSSFEKDLKKGAGAIGTVGGFLIGGPAGAAIGGAIGGAISGNEAAGDAADAQAAGQNALIAEQRAAREQSRADLQPFTDIGLSAGEQLQSLMGNPMQGLEEINPMVSFLRDQGFEDIQESAAARGRLGAGGTMQDMTQFNTQLAATVVPQLQQQKFNQLFNVLGLGQNSAAGQGVATLQTANQIGNSMGNIGNIRAGEVTGKANAITGGLNSAFGAMGGFGGGGTGGGFTMGGGFTQPPAGAFNNNLSTPPQF